MDSAQIIRTLRNVDSFLGVFPSDLLPRSISRSGTLTVNTDPHTEKGSHWLAIKFQTKSYSESILIPTASSLIFIPSNHYSVARVPSGTSTPRKYRVSHLRSVGITAVYLPFTWIGDILLTSLSACFIPTLLTDRSNRCSTPNLNRYANDHVGVSAAPV
jgi:hypothetical protein